MSDLMRDDVSLGKIAGRFKSLAQLTIESQVDINFLVVAAIKRPRCRLGEAAGRLNLAGKEHELRLRVITSGALENFTPSSLGAAEDAGNELTSVVSDAALR